MPRAVAARATAPSASRRTHHRFPAARKIAAESGVDLASVGRGSGPGGRLLSSDDCQCSRRGKACVPRLADGNPPINAARRCRRCAARSASTCRLRSKPFRIFMCRPTIDADPLLAFYRQQKPQANCTLNDVVVLAVGRAMAEFPAVRSQIDGNDIVEFPHANIGVAVGVDEGLVVPVVLNVDTLSLAQLASGNKTSRRKQPQGQARKHRQGQLHDQQPRHVRRG